jgi:hypothetical protein
MSDMGDRISVRILRSYDYCHFEITLGRSCYGLTLMDQAEDADTMRKTAARLADKAVEQYKIAKENAELAMRDKNQLEHLIYCNQETLAKPESDWTPEEKATAKAITDRKHRNRPRYDYQDDFQEASFDEDDDEKF